MRRGLLSACAIVCILSGCYGPNESPVHNCLMRPSYLFNQFGNWARASQTILDVTDPANPAVSHRDSYGGKDTFFTIGQAEYSQSGSWLYIDSTPTSYKNIVHLTAVPRHLAAAGGVLCFVRHVPDTSAGSAWCWRGYDTINALEVDDLSRDSTMTFRTTLADPQDISIYGSTLYVLDAVEGLKIYSIADAKHPTLVATVGSIRGYHMDITTQGTMIVHTAAGLIQYDLSNATSPSLLTKIQ